MAPNTAASGEQTSLAERKRRAGQRLILGFEGPHIDDNFRKVIREIQPAGFVLFARNVVSPKQVRELNQELASLSDPLTPPLLAVDQEGGRVQRMRSPATVWPAMRAVGRAKDHTEDVAAAMAIELRAVGFNVNFAPVADVNSNPQNPVIGDRSFGTNATEVAQHVRDFIRGHQGEGMIACAKHFPGHGDTSLDSHHALPSVDRSEASLEALELVPFRAAIEAGVATVMLAHVMFPTWDPEYPATLSERIGRGILRKRLGFSGLVFSDDMEMGAIAGRVPLDIQAERTTRAGIDILLCCRSSDLQWRMHRELIRIQEQSPDYDVASRQSEQRLNVLRRQFLLAPPAVPDLLEVGCPAHQQLAKTVSRRGQHVTT